MSTVLNFQKVCPPQYLKLFWLFFTYTLLPTILILLVKLIVFNQSSKIFLNLTTFDITLLRIATETSWLYKASMSTHNFEWVLMTPLNVNLKTNYFLETSLNMNTAPDLINVFKFLNFSMFLNLFKQWVIHLLWVFLFIYIFLYALARVV